MEPEVHIVEKYFQVVKHCFTITNIKCEHGHEIDLLAIKPKKFERFHVEVKISTAFHFRLTETRTKKGDSMKDRLGHFDKEKFNNRYVTEKIKEYFGDEPYKQILCVYDVHKEGGSGITNSIQSEAKKLGIDVRSISLMIDKLKESDEIVGSRDDILRLLDLMNCCEKKIPKIYGEKRLLKMAEEDGTLYPAKPPKKKTSK